MKTRILDSSNFIYTVNYYDKYGRLIQQYESNREGGYNRTSNVYDFTSKITKQQICHKKTSSLADTTIITVEQTNTYDHMGRLIDVNNSYNGQPAVNISHLDYDEVGRLKDKKLHKSQQIMDYAYNIRGWLTKINNPDATYSDSRAFSMQLYYNEGLTGLNGAAEYNGNISGARWRTQGGTVQGYGYQYDGVNRLLKGDYGTWNGSSWTNSTAYDETIGGYDANGNIQKLIRKNSSLSNRDSLIYNYSGNQLTSISGTLSGNYSYDNNGNAKSDGLHGLSIIYNTLNLPKSYAQNNDSCKYVYDAGGMKWSKTAIKGGKASMTQYYGPFVYVDGALSYVLTNEGFVENKSGLLKYHYYLKDHLGNTRFTFYYNDTTLWPEQTEDYYPFGLLFTQNNTDKNPYLYNGKELQCEFFENYDYGARFYDPQIGRWHNVDPLAELHFNFSQYTFCYNNPIKFIDPLGLDTIPVNNVNWPKFDYKKDVIGLNSVTVTPNTNNSNYSSQSSGGIMHSIFGDMGSENFGYHLSEYNNPYIWKYSETNGACIIMLNIGASEFCGGLIAGCVRYFAARVGVQVAAKEGTTIIGEGMKRVGTEAAKRMGSVILNDMPKYAGTADQVTTQMMTYNRQWILQQMRSGRPILDIGLDATRTNPSIFYQMEQNMIKNYLKLHPNAFQIIKP